MPRMLRDRMKMQALRKTVQAAAGLVSNAHLSGFLTGKLYSGGLKRFCVPGLNCYSCPGAAFACPIGSLQSFLTARRPGFPFYVLGFLLFCGILCGRFICGWLCLFGLLQELLYRVPLRKFDVPERADRVLRYGKYVSLFVLAVLLPLLVRNAYGMGTPWFCKLVCPAGTLEGGIPLLLLNPPMRGAAGFLFSWKVLLLLGFLYVSMKVYRPFCRYVCPLGAFYALCQRFSLFGLRYEKASCVRCGRCNAVCPMKADPVRNAADAECIRCGACVEACPEKALSFGRNGKTSYDFLRHSRDRWYRKEKKKK